jgi:TRAP-type C4-dicarboxylate transport system substrate-binding protein
MDRDQLLKEAVSIQLISIPSKTFKKAMLTQIASQFLESLTPEEQAVIRREISEGVDGMEDDEMYAKQSEDRESAKEMHEVTIQGMKKANSAPISKGKK